MVCPKGHIIQETYEVWRKKHECSECAKLAAKASKRNKLP